MTFRPRLGDSVTTPSGVGIVVQVVGIPSGNGARVFLMERSMPNGSALPIFHIGEIEPGPPLSPLSVSDYVVTPGGHPGTVLSVDGNDVLCAYQVTRPRVMRQGRFPHWRLIVATMAGR